jgi:hypothetical protein
MVYIFRLLSQLMSPRCPNLKEGGYDAATVSGKTETEGHLSGQFDKLDSGWLILSDQLRWGLGLSSPQIPDNCRAKPGQTLLPTNDTL